MACRKGPAADKAVLQTTPDCHLMRTWQELHRTLGFEGNPKYCCHDTHLLHGICLSHKPLPQLCLPYHPEDLFCGPAKFSIMKQKITEKNFRGFGPYALVTGAASGMGRLYALRLAGMGYNLLLVDINSGGLDETVRQVKEMADGFTDFRAASVHKADFRAIVQDLSLQSAASDIAAAASGCDVEVLVNNAGIMYCQTIAATSPRALSLMMMLHMYTPLMICREFVPGMVARGRGYILNISSLAAWMDWPGIGMYGNTKRFIKGFSRQLRIECRGTGVSVTNAYFGAVDTPLVPLTPKYRRLARFLRVMIPAETAVNKALSATFRRRRGTMPGLVNHIFKPVVMALPDSVLAWMLKKLAPILMNV